MRTMFTAGSAPLLLGWGICVTGCPFDPTPPVLGDVLTWDGAPTADVSAHPLHRSRDPEVVVDRDRSAEVPVGEPLRAIDSDPVGLGAVYYQCVGSSCAGDREGPY